MQTTEKMTFQAWLKGLNRLVVAKYGIGLDDLPDMMTRDWFEDDLTIYQAMEEVAESVEEDFGLDADDGEMFV